VDKLGFIGIWTLGEATQAHAFWTRPIHLLKEDHQLSFAAAAGLPTKI